MKCDYCHCEMVDGEYMAQTAVVSDEGTHSFGGPGVLADCLKCPQCGWSRTKPCPLHIPVEAK
jgi:hypothetical protein